MGSTAKANQSISFGHPIRLFCNFGEVLETSIYPIQNIPWSYLFRGPSDQTVGSSIYFAIETNGIIDHTDAMDHLNHTKQVRTQDGPFTMVVETNGPTVWPDIPRNKYDTSADKIFHYYLQEQQKLMNKVHLEG